MSDTHGHHEELEVPEGDILIHAGDFSKWHGTLAEVTNFAKWMGSLPHKVKIAIAGNHDEALQGEPRCHTVFGRAGVLYLRDTGIVLWDDLKIYGSPWTPTFGDWAFMLDEAELTHKWRMIPDDVDVLITHGGPASVLDRTSGWVECGSVALRERVFTIAPERPLVHIFGHIHEAYGSARYSDYSAFNVAICDLKYDPVNPCTVIEVE